MISASGFLDGVYNVLASASEFGSEVVTRNDYNVLTQAPGACSLVLRYRGTRPEASTYASGRGRHRVVSVELEVEGYVREEADLAQVLDHQVQLADALYNVLVQDETFGGTVFQSSVDVTAQAGFIVEMGGFRWVPLTATVIGRQSC